MRPGEAGDGVSIFTMPASRWLLPPHGLVSIGVLSVLADGPLGCAIQSQLPPATPYTTAELSLTSVRPVRATGGTLTARGRVVHPGRRMALSEVYIEDETGRLVAHGTSRCMILPTIDGLPPAGSLEPAPQPDDSDDPWRRPVMGEVLAQPVWDQYSGLEILQRALAGELPRPPLSYLTGLRPTEVSQGSATFVLPASGWLCPPTGLVEGGMIALLADSAIQSAIQTTIPAATAMASIDLKVNFLRPAPPDGRETGGPWNSRPQGTVAGDRQRRGPQPRRQAGGYRHGVGAAAARPAGLTRGRPRRLSVLARQDIKAAPLTEVVIQ
jgi:uncharacterized protein (TIGR00369 family)